MRRAVRAATPRVMIAMVIMFALGCEREMTVSDLSGTWTLTRDSRERLSAELRRPTGALIMDSSGTFAARDVPGQIFDQGPRLITGSGRWQIGERGLRLDLLAVTNGDASKVPFSTHFRASDSILRFFIGDPDDFNTIEFQKVGE